MYHLLVRVIGAVFFFDRVRMIELFSMANLFAWGFVLATTPGLFERDTYKAFEVFSQTFWAALFIATSLGHVIGFFVQRGVAYEVRFTVMACAAALWAVVAVNFWVTGISTTANFNYLILAGLCAISGAYLGWKSTSYHS